MIGPKGSLAAQRLACVGIPFYLIRSSDHSRLLSLSRIQQPRYCSLVSGRKFCLIFGYKDGPFALCCIYFRPETKVLALNQTRWDPSFKRQADKWMIPR